MQMNVCVKHAKTRGIRFFSWDRADECDFEQAAVIEIEADNPSPFHSDILNAAYRITNSDTAPWSERLGRSKKRYEHDSVGLSYKFLNGGTSKRSTSVGDLIEIRLDSHGVGGGRRGKTEAYMVDVVGFTKLDLEYKGWNITYAPKED
jgi:queuine/archaeosine tRNA-ribosyltransferase